MNNMQCKTRLIMGVFIIAGYVTIAAQDYPAPNDKEKIRIHDKALTIDTHCDTPMKMLEQGFDIGKLNGTGKVDLPRMKDGGLDAIFFAVFVPQEKRTQQNYNNAYALACKMIDTVQAAMNRHGDLAEIALTADDATRIEKAGKRAIYLGMENGFPLARELSRVDEFYRKGIRYITLSHSSHNDICDSSTDREKPEHNGLSTFGRQVVMEMNRLGMIIDVSHISDKAFFDVAAISFAPVIASHSSVRAIAHHDRNLSDDMIRALAKNGGVIQICLLDDYIKDPDTASVYYEKLQELRNIRETRWKSMNETEKEAWRTERNELEMKNTVERPSVKDFVDHIDYVVRLVGVNHVGIGSDFDGGGGLKDCRDVSQMPCITRELLRRGYSGKNISKIWGGNFFRVFRKVEDTARKISGKRSFTSNLGT